MAEDSKLYESSFFAIERVAEGVYAALGNPDEGVISNAGIVDLGETVLVVDSFELVEAARDLVRGVDHLTGKPVSILLTTHAHDDHYIGNGVFPPETRIVSSAHNRDEIAAEMEEASEEDIQGLRDYVADMEEQLAEAADDAARKRLTRSITRFSRFLGSLDEMVIRPPDVTFEDRLVLHGTRRRVELIHYGAGHTASDLIAYLPDDRILFPGDLVLVKTQPFMFFSDPDQWRIVLDQIEALDFETLVPGHGPVGSVADVAAMRQYFDVMEQLVGQMVIDGASAEDVAKVPVPDEFEEWSGGAYGSNLQFLYERLGGEDRKD